MSIDAALSEKLAPLYEELRQIRALLEARPMQAGLSREEAAAYIGVSVDTMKRLLRDGQIPCGKIGERVIVRRDDLEEYLLRIVRYRDGGQQCEQTTEQDVVRVLGSRRKRVAGQKARAASRSETTTDAGSRS